VKIGFQVVFWVQHNQNASLPLASSGCSFQGLVFWLLLQVLLSTQHMISDLHEKYAIVLIHLTYDLKKMGYKMMQYYFFITAVECTNKNKTKQNQTKPN